MAALIVNAHRQRVPGQIPEEPVFVQPYATWWLDPLWSNLIACLVYVLAAAWISHNFGGNP